MSYLDKIIKIMYVWYNINDYIVRVIIIECKNRIKTKSEFIRKLKLDHMELCICLLISTIIMSWSSAIVLNPNINVFQLLHSIFMKLFILTFVFCDSLRYRLYFHGTVSGWSAENYWCEKIFQEQYTCRQFIFI